MAEVTAAGERLPYDPELRRDTPLAMKLAADIRAHGPIPLSHYFTACMDDADHGYYRTRAGVGASGDFTTAPEISQVFGELIGLWCAVVWQQMGSPSRFVLLEWGPGRGTLMADALRATRIVPGFRAAAEVAMIETSAPFAAMQDAALGSLGVTVRRAVRIDDLLLANPDLAGLPTIMVGNEFLDTLPPEQYVLAGTGWRRRHVGLDAGGRLAWVDEPVTDGPDCHVADGEIATVVDYGGLQAMLSAWPMVAALFVDYGSDGARCGDSLQAVRNHAYEHPLTSPGEADLTTLVDFAALGEVARTHVRTHAFAVDGPTTQAEFLGALGIVERASRLMAANPAKAATIEAGVARLIGPGGMGTRFKAIGIRSPHLPPLPGLPTSSGQ